MKRAPSQLSEKVYDVAIIGGGIYGACVAYDAALRGLSVALVDQGDFGNATSANSQKIIHGGLRYLQHADVKRMRESIRERSIFMRVAPHLVYPMPFLVPIYDSNIWVKAIMSVAFTLNDIIGFDRNRDLAPDKCIPRSRIISTAECLELCPNLDERGLKGGAVFYDGQASNPDRLTLSFLMSAARAGADLANYVRVTGFVQELNSIKGFKAKDTLTGIMVEVRARLIVNCSGPWIDHVLNLLGNGMQTNTNAFFKAVVLVTQPVFHKIAVGLPCRAEYRDADAIVNKGYRYFFITPWRNTSLIGTFYAPYDDDPNDFHLREEDISEFLEVINAAYPIGIKRQDVLFAYGGLLPSGDRLSETDDIQYAKHYRIHDHEHRDGISGIISVVGVKYTTARDVAEKTVDLVLKKLGRSHVGCQTNRTPVHGGAIDCFEEFVAEQLREKPADMSPETIRHLIQTYGSEYREILRYCEEDQAWRQPVMPSSPVTRAEVLHGIREEMAQKLTDVIFRRTELGTAGYPGDACLKTCAEIMAAELGWNEQRTLNELGETRAAYFRLGCVPWIPMSTVSVSS